MGVRTIEKTLFEFIWKYSRRDQLVLLASTTALFPFLYLTLELPKRIINDAIGAQSNRVEVLGFDVDQVVFLGLLCMAFLASVLVHGLLKMRINTMTGVLSERMLRRLRYALIARMMRFPKPYFQRTSQGELVAMITGETEPMGGMMGEALSQPVLQAGQMLTILVFLFLQSFWFGLAAIALIPLQAWLIPRLQRQINLMNKERIKEIRKLAGMIGETANGAADLRIHGGGRHRLALISDRLGIVYRIRFRIFQKKFLMKFINNFITQLTPFFFFSIGGYLVIQGAVSLGALVAALAAYKDLSSPWKELLTYYNQAQDMSLRWETVTEKFTPPGAVDARLIDLPPDDTPHLSGPIELQDVSVVDGDGRQILGNISATFPQGAIVGIKAAAEEDRLALADLLTREVLPADGKVRIGVEDLAALHQSVLARRIGHANSSPVLFEGSFGDNVMMALRTRPRSPQAGAAAPYVSEALAAGNSPDPVTVSWLDPESVDLQDEAALRRWWLRLVEAMGSSGPLFRKSLDQRVAEAHDPALIEGLVAVRPKIREAVAAAGLERHVFRFDPELYNPALPLAGNLFFASLRRPLSQKELLDREDLFDVLSELGLEDDLLHLSTGIIDLLHQIFGTDGTEHPLFRKLGLEPALFEHAVRVVQSAKSRPGTVLSDVDRHVLMTVPAQITAEQIGSAFPEEIKLQILGLRAANTLKEKETLTDIFVPLDETKVSPGLTVLENALFGKISEAAGPRADEVRAIVAQVLEAEGLKPGVMELIYDLELSLNGANLASVFAESLSLSRAAIKKPDILIMDQILNSFDHATRAKLHKNLRVLLPETTLIYLSEDYENTDVFDVYLEIRQGRLVSDESTRQHEGEGALSVDLARKVRALEATDMFSGLSRKQLRLLAFGAKWYTANAGEVVFRMDDDPGDGAYMVLSGTAGLYKPGAGGDEKLVATVGPGKLVGELGLIRNVPRALTMRAQTDFHALRLGAEEFLAVVENDAATSFKLLQVVAGYTS